MNKDNFIGGATVIETTLILIGFVSSLIITYLDFPMVAMAIVIFMFMSVIATPFVMEFSFNDLDRRSKWFNDRRKNKKDTLESIEKILENFKINS